MQASEIRRLAEGLLRVALAAARAQMAHFGTGMEVERKADQSPVTAADRQSEGIILAGLARLAPGVPVIAEEEVAAGRIPDITGPFFLVDPLDGTKGFIKGKPEFTINIGLIEARVPVFGLLYAPALADFYVTLAPNEAANARTRAGIEREQPGRVRPAAAAHPRARSPCAGGTDQPVAPQSGDRELPGGLQCDRAAGAGVLPEVWPHRQGRGRRLPARRADLRVGHGRGTRGAGGSRRRGDGHRWCAAPLRQRRARVRESRFRGLGPRAIGEGAGGVGSTGRVPRLDAQLTSTSSQKPIQ